MSVRWILLLVLSGLVALATGALVAFTSIDQARASRDLSRKILGDALDHAESRVTGMLQPIRGALLTHYHQIASGHLRRDDPHAITRFVLPTMRDLSSVGSAMIGDGAGYQMLVMRYDEQVVRSPLLAGNVELPVPRTDLEQFFTREFRGGSLGDRAEWTLLDERGREPVAQWSGDIPGYDPATRPWCVAAMARLAEIEAAGAHVAAADHIAWTDVYSLLTTREPGVSASIAVRGPEGDVTVVAYDLLLDDLSAFTRAERPTERGVVFACDADGRVIGLPGEAEFDDAARRAAAHLCPLPALGSATLRSWHETWTATASSQHQPFAFQADGEAWLGDARPLTLGRSTTFWLGVAIPRADVVAATGIDPSKIWFVGGAGLLLAILASNWISKSISRPLTELVRVSERIGALDLADRQLPRSKLREVDTLSSSLSTMRTALHEQVVALEKSHRERAATEARHRVTYEQAAVAILHVDLQGRILSCNSRFCQLVARSSEALVGSKILDISHPDDVRRDAERMRALAAGEVESEHWNKRILRSDGVAVWISVSATLCSPDESPARYIISVVQDISERKRLEERLHQSQKLEAIGELAGGLAHDFNNVLTVIMGHTELARAALSEEHQAQAHLSAVQRAAEGATRLIRQIMVFARHGAVQAASCDAAQVLRDGAANVTHLLGPSIQLELDVAPGVHRIAVSAVQLEQLVGNLAVNARDAMANGGRFSIRLRRERGQVLIWVRDNGVGMSEEVRRRIFEPFFTTKEFGRGTGLGLAVCYGVVRAANGEIQVTSAPGEGATFELRFPELHDATPTVAAPEPARPLPSGATILVVDDEDSIRDLVDRMLSSRGYRVLTAGDAEEALEILEREAHVALLITDISMPGLEGPELAERARALHASLAVLFMSGYSRAGFEGKQGVPVLEKPFGPAELLAAVVRAYDPRSTAPARSAPPPT